MKTDKLFYDEFHLAGCQYWDVTEAWDKLRIGLKVKLEREIDNRYDPDAIAVLLPCTDDEEDKEFYKLGYVPRSHNGDLAKLLEMGWDNIFECRISKISPEQHYENQIRMTLKIKRNKMGL